MSTQLKLRRGTTAQHSTFTGASGEITVDTDKKTVVVHDGSTAGGNPLLTANGSQVISANTSTDALRITQTGSGNAIVVEDSANPDGSPFVVDANGAVSIGVTQGTDSLNIYQNGRNYFNLGRASDNALASVFANYKARGTYASKTIVQSSDAVGKHEYYGWDGSAFIPAVYISAEVDGTPSTNDMPGRLVFSTTADGASSPTEAMRIDSGQRIGIGPSGTVAGTNLYLTKNIAGATFAYGFREVATINSGVTVGACGLYTSLSTTAASFTLPSLYHYISTQGTIGAGSTVTNQYGFFADHTLTGATNNYGFFSNIASGTGRYNFYAAGSADNYFAGNVGIGVAPAVKLQVAVSDAATTIGSSTAKAVIQNLSGAALNQNAAVEFNVGSGALSSNRVAGIYGVYETYNATALGGALVLATNAAGSTSITERMRIDSSGNLIHTAPTTAPTLSTNGTMVFNLTSNTNLRVSVRGSDGVTRTANITLA